MRELTKAEEQVMQILWKLERAFVKDIIERLPEPKPAYNTISTIIRILEKKEIVGHEIFGKTYRYFPLINKKDYTKAIMKGLVNNYFSNSYKQMASFFTKENDLSLKDLVELQKLINNQIEIKKGAGNE